MKIMKAKEIISIIRTFPTVNSPVAVSIGNKTYYLKDLKKKKRYFVSTLSLNAKDAITGADLRKIPKRKNMRIKFPGINRTYDTISVWGDRKAIWLILRAV